MRTYKLKILQKKYLDNVENYLHSLFLGSQFVELVSVPRRKSFRDIPPGIKWVDCVVNVDVNHLQEFQVHLTHDEYFKIQFERLN